MLLFILIFVRILSPYRVSVYNILYYVYFRKEIHCIELHRIKYAKIVPFFLLLWLYVWVCKFVVFFLSAIAHHIKFSSINQFSFTSTILQNIEIHHSKYNVQKLVSSLAIGEKKLCNFISLQQWKSHTSWRRHQINVKVHFDCPEMHVKR